VNDQDFFFDEEPESKKPAQSAAKSSSAKPAPSAAKSSSAKPASSGAARSSAPNSAKPAVSAPATVASGLADQSTTMAVAALVGVGGLLLGAILGFLLGNTVGKASTAAPKATATPAQTSTSGSGSSAQPGPLPAGVTTLPPGHLPVSVPATNSAAATPTK
jgi:hypothetical protein